MDMKSGEVTKEIGQIKNLKTGNMKNTSKFECALDYHDYHWHYKRRTIINPDSLIYISAYQIYAQCSNCKNTISIDNDPTCPPTANNSRHARVIRDVLNIIGCSPTDTRINTILRFIQLEFAVALPKKDTSAEHVYNALSLLMQAHVITKDFK
jgi:hypothetical protein